MRAEMKLRPSHEGTAEISLSVPAAKAGLVAEAIRGMMKLGGHKVRWLNNNGEELLSADEVFPDASPAKALRGLRGKEDLTQVELAARLGISQNMVSDMEIGKRTISLKMAKRIAETFKVPYKLFL
ncbi:MAG: helix-turn-helix domain-containing protein [Desulfovibrio sp.]|jgi:DNA-binding XRE family transcriptional regulator|nr:helix-turn-helix domain-containing protein [Desulfovibrio sp.]